MSISIHDEQVCALIRAGAARTGQDPADMVEAAVMHYLHSVGGVRLAQTSNDIVTRCEAALNADSDVLTTADFAAAVAADADTEITLPDATALA